MCRVQACKQDILKSKFYAHTKKLRIDYIREFLISFGQESVVFMFAIKGLGLGSIKAESIPECGTMYHICGILSFRDPRRTGSTTTLLWKSLNTQGIWA